MMIPAARTAAMPCRAGRSRRSQGVTMTAGYRDFRPRDEDPNDHAAVAAMQVRSEAVKADEAFRQAMLAAIAAARRLRSAPWRARTCRSSFAASNEGSD